MDSQIEVNGVFYDVKEVAETDVKLLFNYSLVNGLCDAEKRIIYINKDRSINKKMQTLAHELTHAYLCETLLHKDEYNVEEVCNIMGKYVFLISNKILDFYKEEMI